jgi:hypothetical protein
MEEEYSTPLELALDEITQLLPQILAPLISIHDHLAISGGHLREEQYRFLISHFDTSIERLETVPEILKKLLKSPNQP